MNTLIQPNYQSLIFEFRGYKVMIDSDLASLYGVATKALKQQVSRNKERFPKDFMFELNLKEKRELIKSCKRLSLLKHSSVKPLAFTEQGVAMLSSVLRSDKAIHMNIEIMRAFAHYRALLQENKSIRSEVKKLDQKLNTAIQLLLQKIDDLHQSKNKTRAKIGYKR